MVEQRIITDRSRHYGPVGPNIERIAALWSAYLGVSVTGHDVGWMMTLLKASRSRVDPNHLDNYEDAKGYIEIAERMRMRESLAKVDAERKETFD